MPKKNGFVMYLEARRPGFVAAGVQLTGGFKELADLCSRDWAELPEHEKKRFADDAKFYNERIKREGGDVSCKSKRKQVAAVVPAELKKSTENPYKATDDDNRWLHESREIVRSMFECDWLSQPIVICSFTLCVEPGFDHFFLPAEIGLTAMSVENGVIDNYARIIDPVSIPKGYGIEAIQKVQQLGLPQFGMVPDFADYEPVMMIVDNFLQKHKGNYRGKELYVFAFDSDYRMISQCFEWLFQASGIRLSIKVLSLDTFAFLASSNSTSALKLRELGDNFMSLPGTTKVSSFRTQGKSLSGRFIYNSTLPTCPFGMFVELGDVEKSVKEVDNYKYYEELCCVYHIKSGREIHNCALNMSNRYAFSLLELLTLCNEVPITPGKHFPETGEPEVEKRRRYRMLQLWGLTRFEEEMKEEVPIEPERPIRERDRRQFQRRVRRDEEIEAEPWQEDRGNMPLSRYPDAEVEGRPGTEFPPRTGPSRNARGRAPRSEMGTEAGSRRVARRSREEGGESTRRRPSVFYRPPEEDDTLGEAGAAGMYGTDPVLAHNVYGDVYSQAHPYTGEVPSFYRGRCADKM